ncbi:hypothetical protein CERSUDRAFT_115749 [Gelatoporia subvermispora B]|uniref:Uncharacterized protein n=1 Tax=Ceriporiopsis subvermispora (strain B) TaxID=914234 RepID=M2RAJ4_CERS8|nr:hypothetical protein CERSUDRAFT_115749 [Gelatoporia subvermispora B]
MVTLDQQRSGSSTWTVYTWETSGETRILTTSDVVPATIPLLGPPEERNIASSHTYTIQAKLLKRLPCGWAPGVVVSFDMSRFFNSSGDMAGVYELRADINELAPVTIYVHQSSHDAAFSPDGNLVASRTLDQGIILFWDACSGKSVTQYLGHTNLILSLCFSPNNDLLASGSSDGTLRIWDTAIRNSDASDPSVARGHTRPVDFLRISPDGRYAASLSSYEVQVVVWNMADGMIMHTLPVEDSDKYSFFRTVAFNTDSSLLLCAGAGPHCARIWNLESGNVEATFVYAEDEEKGPSLHLAEFSSSGAYIAVGRIYYPYSEHEDGKLHRIDIWDVAEATVISTHQISRSEELHRPLSLTFSRDGRYISLKSLKDNVSCRLDIHNGEEYWEAVSPEPSQGLFKLEDGWITLAESSRKLFWIQSDRRAYYGGEEWGNLMPAFTSLGSLVALGSGIGEVTLLDLSGLLAPQQSS